jgi:uncharacterized protein YutE (UPF0331/DUF86 family)
MIAFFETWSVAWTTERMDELLSRLKRLEENLRELAHFQNTTLADLDDDQTVRWGLRYGVMETVQIAIDLACAIVSRRNLGDPDQPADCFRLLRQTGVLSEAVADRLIQTLDARDTVAAAGPDVNDALVLDVLDRLSDFRMFAREIRDFTPPSGADS